MKQEIKRDYKEIAKTNTFVAHAAEIREIGKVNNVDVGIAADMYIANHSLTRTPELTKATAIAVKDGTTNGEMKEGLRQYNEAISKFREFERQRIAE